MYPYGTAVKPEEWVRLGWKTSLMMAEAQMVISLRVWGMMGLLPVARGENSRMVSEKLSALQDAQAAALRAMMRGASPFAVAEAALRPVGRRTRANAARLQRSAIRR